MVERKYITEFIIDHASRDKVLKEHLVLPESDKQKVLSYLTRFPVFAATTAVVTDKITGVETNTYNNCRSDGTYYWYESEIYHFKKYNVKLEPAFVDYVLGRS